MPAIGCGSQPVHSSISTSGCTVPLHLGRKLTRLVSTSSKSLVYFNPSPFSWMIKAVSKIYRIVFVHKVIMAQFTCFFLRQNKV